MLMNAIDEYIAAQDETMQANLKEVCQAIRSQLPDAEEKISWGMPTWHHHHNLIHMACANHHIGIYPGADGVEAFAGVLKQRGFRFSKGAIQIPYGDKLPLDLIKEIAGWCGVHHGEK